MSFRGDTVTSLKQRLQRCYDLLISYARDEQNRHGCQCADVEMGSYDNTVLLGYYPVMREYMANRLTAGLSGNGIPVDKCLVSDVISLWEAGIRTHGCCCGHSQSPGFINLDERDFDKALAIGWEKYEFDDDLDRRDTIKPKYT